MIQRLTKVCSALLLFLVCVFAGAAKTQADPISFTTTGGFFGSGASGSNSITYGSGGNTVTFTFIGVNNALANPPTPVNSSGAFLTAFGQIQVTVTGDGATVTPTDLVINFSQTVPNAGTFSLTARLQGAVTPTSSTARLAFTNGTFGVLPYPGGGGHDKIVYTIDFVGSGFVNLAAPNANGGVTNLNGTVGAVPEPGTLILLGSGLAGLAAGARRRLRKRL